MTFPFISNHIVSQNNTRIHLFRSGFNPDSTDISMKDLNTRGESKGGDRTRAGIPQTFLLIIQEYLHIQKNRSTKPAAWRLYPFRRDVLLFLLYLFQIFCTWPRLQGGPDSAVKNCLPMNLKTAFRRS